VSEREGVELGGERGERETESKYLQIVDKLCMFFEQKCSVAGISKINLYVHSVVENCFL